MGMKATLFATFVALLVVGCGEEGDIKQQLLEEGKKRQEEQKRKYGVIIAEAIDWTEKPSDYTGWVRSVYDNGQIEWLTQYKDGKKDGLATVWTDNGQKVSELTWEDDDKLMTAVAWKPNGEKCPVTNVVNGNGVKVWYNNDGTEIYRLTYKDGETVRD